MSTAEHDSPALDPLFIHAIQEYPAFESTFRTPGTRQLGWSSIGMADGHRSRGPSKNQTSHAALLGQTREGQRLRPLRHEAGDVALSAFRSGCYTDRASRALNNWRIGMRERHKTGSLVFDKSRGTWRFLQWVDGKRKSQTIGTKQEYPTKASAWKAVKRLPVAVATKTAAPTVSTLVEHYRAEKMPERLDTRRTYNAWLKNHIVPKWGECEITDVQARP